MVPVYKHLPINTDSEESYAFAASALGECLNGHETCNNREDEFVPTRLLDVGKEGDAIVRIVHSRELSSDTYIALSHCWGPPETITTKLTRSNYVSYSRGVWFDDLPKTFRDAVTFTRALGCGYLWIDSMCIIQDDEEDWRQEAATMCQVYENSLITLAAASSSSGRGGLFYQFPRIEQSGIDANSDQPYTIFARSDMNHLFFDFPLMNRAWVMQERLLAPRTLYFTSQELVWECRTSTNCQCTPDAGGFVEKSLEFPRSLKLSPDMAGVSPQVIWHQVVSVYSRLKMTMPSDKLIAIHGVAQFMNRVRTCRYLGGVWEDSFAQDLLWAVGPSDVWSEKPLRPEEWRAPTWSWASVEREVTYNDDIEQSALERSLEVVRWPHIPKGVCWETSSSESQFTLRGVLVQTTVGEADIVVGSTPCLRADANDWNPSPGYTKDTEPLYCLRMMESEKAIYSLALRKVHSREGNVFERHGILVFEGDPTENNMVWNPRTVKSRFDRPLTKGYPVWWKEGVVADVTIA